MSDIEEFRSLWNQQPTPEKPDSSVLIRKAVRHRNKTRNKWLMANITCLLTGLFIAYIWINIDVRLLVTKIGLIVILTGILAFVLVTAQTIQPLFKSNEQFSNSDFLSQMLKLKKNQDFIQKTFMDIYFFLISTGVLLYMYEFTQRMSLFWGIVCYTVTITWMGLNWFYIKPRTVRKQSEKLNKVISDLEEINGQGG